MCFCPATLLLVFCTSGYDATRTRAPVAVPARARDVPVIHAQPLPPLLLADSLSVLDIAVRTRSIIASPALYRRASTGHRKGPCFIVRYVSTGHRIPYAMSIPDIAYHTLCQYRTSHSNCYLLRALPRLDLHHTLSQYRTPHRPTRHMLCQCSTAHPPALHTLCQTVQYSALARAPYAMPVPQIESAHTLCAMPVPDITHLLCQCQTSPICYARTVPSPPSKDSPAIALPSRNPSRAGCAIR
eukprot:2712499-Rhodomonas_salina.3